MNPEKRVIRDEEFHAFMQDGVVKHNLGDYSAAILVRTAAYEGSLEGTNNRAHAARDLAASIDRLPGSDPEEAMSFAREAYNTHRDIDIENQTWESARERAQSVLYLGVLTTRAAIKNELSGNTADTLQPLEQAREALEMLNWSASLATTNEIDQYKINAARRISIIESIYGDNKLGRKIAFQAIKIAGKSESPKLPTSTENLSTSARFKAKTKAYLGGIAALGVNIVSISKTAALRNTSLKLANKVL